MRLLIDTKDLELLVEKKRDYIGNQVTFDTWIAAVSFILSVLTAQYDQIGLLSGNQIKTIFILIGIIYLMKIGKRSMMKKYDHENLIVDINNLNLIQHNHSLVIIKHSEHYLLYDDERWQCKLFLNYKTQKVNNEQFILNAVSKDLDIDVSSLSCQYIASRIQEKYSVSHNENRVYNHKLYIMTIQPLLPMMEKDNFVINNKHYYWMTLDDMMNDSDIQEKNSEVVEFVRDMVK